MKLWRLTEARFAAIDGQGVALHGSRYAPKGQPMVNFSDEASLAVLVAVRYAMEDDDLDQRDYLLGWTEVDAVPLHIPALEEQGIRDWVADWLESSASLLAQLPSKVLPEANIVMMNPRHPDAAAIPAMNYRRFSFADTLHRPPMIDVYKGGE